MKEMSVLSKLGITEVQDDQTGAEGQGRQRVSSLPLTREELLARAMAQDPSYMAAAMKGSNED